MEKYGYRYNEYIESSSNDKCIIKDSDVFDDCGYDEELDIEWYDRQIEEEYRKKLKEEHSVKRDKRGRLLAGTKLARKDSCDKHRILDLYRNGKSVKHIVDKMGCSKSTVYAVIKEFKTGSR